MSEKAIFLVGTFGSGKNIILDKVLCKYDLPELTLEQVNSALTTKLSKNDKKNAILRKESIIISTISTNYSGIKVIKETLEEFGYDTAMIFVDAEKNVLLERMKTRDNFDKELFEEKLKRSKRNKYRLKSLFNYYAEYDNSSDIPENDSFSGISFFVDDFINDSFVKIMNETKNKKKHKKKYSLKNKLLGDKIFGIGSNISADNIGPDYSIRNSGAGFPSTVGAFYSESYASDPGVNLPAFSSMERQTPPTEYYSSSDYEIKRKKLNTIKKIAKEKNDVAKT